jgi:1-acyl-sn-glycerol-3-phosphate acyltransferase
MGYKRKWTVVYGNNLHKYPIFRFFLKRVGIPVDRKSQSSKTEVVELMKNALRNGFSLAIFPEGTRMRSFQVDEILLPFKNGAFSVALDLDIPIVPVVFLKPILYSKPDKPFPFSPRIINIKYFDLVKGEENSILFNKRIHKKMKDFLIENP